MQTVLTLDNFSGHGHLEQLQRVIPSWLTIEFLPENTTSVIQPQDGGIIARMKRNYRKRLLNMLVTMSEEDPNLTVDGFKKAVNVLHACMMATDAWQDIDEEAISKVWKRTLLVSNTLFISSEALSKAKRQELEDLEAQVRQTLLTMSSQPRQSGGDDAQLLIDCMVEDMVDEFMRMWFDYDEGAGSELSIEEACETTRQQEEDEGEDEEPEEDVDAVMAHNDARRHLRDLVRYFERHSTDFTDIMSLNMLIEKVNNMSLADQRQKSIEDYFKKN